MTRRTKKKPSPLDGEAVDALLEEMLVDAYGDDEQLGALCCGISEALELPIDAHVIGEPVSLVALDYDGSRRGLVAPSRPRGSSSSSVAAQR